ncbi:MAG: hypothetical protein Q4A07_08710 [Coriobacteriales bacterium]|nr:hypothetical protein [Coriobacteriales bacterium]
MASHKRSALKRQRKAFEAGLGSYGLDGSGVDDVFAQEERRRKTAETERAEALRQKACASKNRYATRGEAQDAIAACAAYGTTGLHAYRCSYCRGWHLTSHPQGESA